MPWLGKAGAPIQIVPEKTPIAEIRPGELESPDLRAIYAIWCENRGGRSMPQREEVMPRPLGRLVRNVSLVKVLADAADYEFRVIGDVHVQAYGANAQGLKFSDLIASNPDFGNVLKASYDLVCARRAPVAFRGFMGREMTQARFDWLETIYMPLRDAEGGVAYVMNASVYVPRNGAWPR
ncbi:MAG: PAS domain-containing protein [Rhizomicrobium sp.]